MRKPLMALAIVACLIMSVVGGLLPILQGWIFFVIAPLPAGHRVRERTPMGEGRTPTLPSLDRWIVRARDHKWAPSHLKEFEDLTDPSK